ncbi:hypothetical protein BN871_AQ_00180 [Paenibacillus sp. P22]|nr:hypothetical protein BN871_AQ_00180 [Paenibacillus sp. P22]
MIVDPGSPDYTLRVTISGDLSALRIVFRYVDDTNEWYVSGNTIFKRVGGSITAAAVMIGTPVSGDVITIQAIKGSIRLFLNGAWQANISDIALMTATKAGIFSSAPAALSYADNFFLEVV